MATQGVYSTEWVPTARTLGLQWLPLLRTGTTVSADDLPAVVDELRRLRTAPAVAPRKAAPLERIDFIFQELDALNPDEVSSIFVG